MAANPVMLFGSKIIAFTRRHPIVRGMASYGLLWPTSCLIQQSIDGKRWGKNKIMNVFDIHLYFTGFLLLKPTRRLTQHVPI